MFFLEMSEKYVFNLFLSKGNFEKKQKIIFEKNSKIFFIFIFFDRKKLCFFWTTRSMYNFVRNRFFAFPEWFEPKISIFKWVQNFLFFILFSSQRYTNLGGESMFGDMPDELRHAFGGSKVVYDPKMLFIIGAIGLFVFTR